MSKQKKTTKPATNRPSIIPILKTRATKPKTKGKPPTDADQTTATPVATDAPPADAGQPTTPVATDTPPVDAAQGAEPATTEAPHADNAQGAATDPGQATTPATETPATDDAKPKKKAKAKKEPKPKKVSCLDAAAQVLTDAGSPMTTGEMIEAMAKKKLWTSPGGQTPAATLYSAILREINTKGKDARFKKTERGKFAAKA